MRNRTLAATAGCVPYIKELRTVAGSPTGAILMQQLDYWFDKHPDGFFKYLSPLLKLGADGKPEKNDAGGYTIEERKGYKRGDSWTEELGFSEAEFLTAFGHIGIRYTSLGSIKQAEQDKMLFLRPDGSRALYCSYFDRKTGLTWYLRNHAAADAALDAVFKAVDAAKQESRNVETNNLAPYKPTFLVSINQDSSFIETNNLGINKRILQETTAETTSENTQDAGVCAREAGQLPLGIYTSDPSPATPPEPVPKPKPGEPKHDPFMWAKVWEQYPRKEAKSKAVQAWDALKPSDDICRAILHDLARSKGPGGRWANAEKRHIPHPATYLNGRRWEDDWTPTKPGQPPPGPKAGFQTRDDREHEHRVATADYIRTLFNTGTGG